MGSIKVGGIRLSDDEPAAGPTTTFTWAHHSQEAAAQAIHANRGRLHRLLRRDPRTCCRDIAIDAVHAAVAANADTVAGRR